MHKSVGRDYNFINNLIKPKFNIKYLRNKKYIYFYKTKKKKIYPAIIKSLVLIIINQSFSSGIYILTTFKLKQ